MEEIYKDINGEELHEGDKVVYEHDTYLGIGIYSHPAGTTVIIKSAKTGVNIRQIQKHQTQYKICKLK